MATETISTRVTESTKKKAMPPKDRLKRSVTFKQKPWYEKSAQAISIKRDLKRYRGELWAGRPNDDHD